ncbi:MAG: Hsp20/alpha crystallin family protein [Leptolyngbyaceae cyanobacterium MO_188.B28]|nr:Hsp20/alpha crystallin family protein [Leptolyngbyaceae cyanobacterium MO_188.B28]
MLIDHQISLRHTESWKSWSQVDHLPHTLRLRSEQGVLGSHQGYGGIAFVPNIEIQETADTLYLNLEVPGMEIEDFRVQASEAVVFVRGDRALRPTIHPRTTVNSEFRYGGFERVIPLPTQIQKTKVHAEYINGILSIILPKQREH